MSTWILILTMRYQGIHSSHCFIHSIEFASKEACEEAAKQWVAQGSSTRTAVCVSKV